MPTASRPPFAGGCRVPVVEVVESLGEPAQIADTVAVRIGEAANEYVVEDSIAPPGGDEGLRAAPDGGPQAGPLAAARVATGRSENGCAAVEGTGLMVGPPQDARIMRRRQRPAGGGDERVRRMARHRREYGASRR